MGIMETAGTKLVNRYFSDTLYRNSFFLLMNRALVVLTGFVFWMVATNLYSDSDVGLAVAFISSAQLIGSISLFGFDTSIIRFFNTYDRSKIFNTSLILVTMASFLVGIIYIVGIKYFSPDLAIIQNPTYAVIFLFFTVALSIATVTAQSFIAMRDAKYSFIQNALLTLRVPLLIPLIFLGSFGILSATFLAYVVAYAVVFYFLGKFLTLSPGIDMGFIKLSYKYSSANYVSNLIYNATFSLLPLIVLGVAGKTDAGLYYIGFTVGNFALQIPLALSTSFFVEGVYGESLKRNVKKIGVVTVAILSVAVAFFWIFGQYVLRLYGKDYIAALDLLRLIALSGFFYAIYILFTMILNMQMKVNLIILLNAILFVLITGLSYFFLLRYGITGVGYAFIIAFAAIDLIIAGMIKRWGWM